MKKTRKEAIFAKDKWYLTGKPCLKGHYSKRATIDGSCYECRIENQRAEREDIKCFSSANNG